MNTYLTLFQIPREARVCFTLYGLNPPTSAKEYQHIKKPIAWVARQLFTSKGYVGYGGVHVYTCIRAIKFGHFKNALRIY